MALDVYAPCPCGSGKKLKFCCAGIADEMDRVSRLIENNQLRQALHLLEGIRKKHPDNAWAVTTEAMVHIEEGESHVARDSLKAFLEKHPDSEFAVVIYATAVLQTSGLDEARRPIHRAFQKGAKQYPGMVSGLAGAMAAVFQSRGQQLAAREHLALAMKFAPEKSRQEIFMRLVEFDSEASTPYLLRSVHPLPTLPSEEPLAAEVKKALKYASVGCWDTSAQVLSTLAEAHPDRPELWHAAGLCRAWDGDEANAAAALHRAAEKYTDRAIAVECEALAQLLDWYNTSQRRKNVHWTGSVSSVSRLLTALDAVPNLQRIELPPPQSPDDDRPAGLYVVTDRPIPETADGLKVDELPLANAQLLVYDADPDANEPAEASLVGFEGDTFNQAFENVRAAAGDTVTWREKAEESGSWAPEETLYLVRVKVFPPGIRVAPRRRLEIARWEHDVREVWPNCPLQALQGRTPREAAGDPTSHVALTAAVYVLDSQCLRWNYQLDVPGQLQALGLEPLPAVTVTPKTSLSAFTPLQWLRIDPAQLTDDQLVGAINRAVLVHHDRFLYDVLKEGVRRPHCIDELDPNRVYQTLSDLCRKHGRREEGFHWLDEGRKATQQEASSFEQMWAWDFRELLARLEDPTDPAVQPLVHKFAHYYAPKLPQARPHLEQIFAAAGVESPWTSGIVTAGGTSPGGLWTPDAAAEPVGAGKLWVPGQ